MRSAVSCDKKRQADSAAADDSAEGTASVPAAAFAFAAGAFPSPPLAKKAKLGHPQEQQQRPVVRHLLHLPDDCMLDIMSYLSLPEVVLLGRTCHEQERAVRDPATCRRLQVCLNMNDSPARLHNLIASPLRFHIVSLTMHGSGRSANTNDSAQDQIYHPLFLSVISACGAHLQCLHLTFFHSCPTIWSFWSSVVRTVQQACPCLADLSTNAYFALLPLHLSAELDMLCGLQMLGTCKQLTSVKIWFGSEGNDHFPLLPVLACVRQLVNLRHVELPLSRPLSIDMYQVMCTTLSCLSHLQTMSQVVPRNAEEVAVLRACWPIAFHWFMGLTIFDPVILRALHADERAVVTSVRLAGFEFRQLDDLDQYVHEQLCHCERLTHFYLEGTFLWGDISAGFIRALIPVVDKIQVLSLESVETRECFQTLIDIRPRNLHTLSISEADFLDPQTLLRQLQALPSLTKLSLNLYRGWGVPWQSHAELRLHLPHLVDYSYMEEIKEHAEVEDVG